MRSKNLKRYMVVAVAGTVLQFGGCLGGVGRLFVKEVFIGAGRQVGAGSVAPLFTGLLPTTTTTTTTATGV